MPDTITAYDGTEVTVEHRKTLPTGGARFDITANDGRKWRIDVTKSGESQDIVTTWRDGTLADLDMPEWMDDVLARLTAA